MATLNKKYLKEPCTPYNHESHKISCHGSETRNTDFYVYTCGAAYIVYVVSFLFWRCYDCGKTAWVDPWRH